VRGARLRRPALVGDRDRGPRRGAALHRTPRAGGRGQDFQSRARAILRAMARARQEAEGQPPSCHVYGGHATKHSTTRIIPPARKSDARSRSLRGQLRAEGGHRSQRGGARGGGVGRRARSGELDVRCIMYVLLSWLMCDVRAAARAMCMTY
jgi:hypothetical protein